MQGPLECGLSVGALVGTDEAGLGMVLQRCASEGTSDSEPHFPSFSLRPGCLPMWGEIGPEEEVSAPCPLPGSRGS